MASVIESCFEWLSESVWFPQVSMAQYLIEVLVVIGILTRVVEDVKKANKHLSRSRGPDHDVTDSRGTILPLADRFQRDLSRPTAPTGLQIPSIETLRSKPTIATQPTDDDDYKQVTRQRSSDVAQSTSGAEFEGLQKGHADLQTVGMTMGRCDDDLDRVRDLEVECHDLKQDNDCLREHIDLMMQQTNTTTTEQNILETLRKENQQLRIEKEDLIELMTFIQAQTCPYCLDNPKTESENAVKIQETTTKPKKTRRMSSRKREQPQGASSLDTVDHELDNSKAVERQTFQLVCVGDSGVGKTSFVRQLCQQAFSNTFTATVGIDFSMKTLYVGGRSITLQLWDTAGQERYRSLSRQYYRKADGVILMYDVTSETSFINLRGWMDSIEEGVVDGTVVAVVGNKADLVDDVTASRVITFIDGATFAKSYNAVFHEGSAKSGVGVTETIEDIVQLMMKQDRSVAKRSSDVVKPRLSERRVFESTCCGVPWRRTKII